LGVSEPAKRVITGAVIVVAVILDAWRQYFVIGGRRKGFRQVSTGS
jgi:ribose/xylose/arabinose/galactoside ABC-type transport system permease subunit